MGKVSEMEILYKEEPRLEETTLESSSPSATTSLFTKFKLTTYGDK